MNRKIFYLLVLCLLQNCQSVIVLDHEVMTNGDGYVTDLTSNSSDRNCIIDWSQININKSYSLDFRCTYHPSDPYNKKNLQAVRIYVKLMNTSKSNTVGITAQQSHVFNAYQLPQYFSSYDDKQPYTTAEELLCPPRLQQSETISFRISTSTSDEVAVKYKLQTVPYLLNKNEKVNISNTPVSPWYKYYEWDSSESSVLVSVENTRKDGQTVCAILSVQNAKCPVLTTFEDIFGGKNRYQTFLGSSGMVVYKSEFPDGIFVLVLPLPDDELCEVKGDISKRTKSVQLTISDHETMSTKWISFTTFFFIACGIYIGFTFLLKAVINRDLSKPIELEHQFLIDNTDEGNQITDVILPDDNANDDNTSLNEENTRVVLYRENTVRRFIPEMPIDDDGYPPELPKITSQSNPRYVMWWREMTRLMERFNFESLKNNTLMNYIFIVALFQLFPLINTVSAFFDIHKKGSEDVCYYNTKCITGFGIFPDFTRMFTNISYIIGGISFVYIVAKHKDKSKNIPINMGVSHHYELFEALGYTLMIQAFMSSLYHACPNEDTIKYDHMFMYIMSIIAIISMWGLRHGDVTAHIAPTMWAMWTMVLVGEVEELFPRRGFFKICMAVVYCLVMLIFTISLIKYDNWSFSPTKMWSIAKQFSEVSAQVRQIVTDDNFAYVHVWTAMRVGVSCLANAGIIFYMFFCDPDINQVFLAICLVNMILYFINYIVTKTLKHGEKIQWHVSLMILFAIVSWIAALVFFFYSNIDINLTPSQSRSKNSNCLLFGTFDSHDLWHLFSGVALYLSLVVILIIDDKEAFTPSNNLAVF